MKVGIPAVVVTGILRSQVNATQESELSIHDGAFLMKRLCDMRDVAAAIVQQAVYAHRSQRLTLPLRVIGQVAAHMIGVPEQHTNAHTAPRRKAKHIHDAQLAGCPQLNRFIAQADCAQLIDKM